jgi:hypothetical protein
MRVWIDEVFRIETEAMFEERIDRKEKETALICNR